MNGKEKRKIANVDDQMKPFVDALDKSDKPRNKSLRKLFKSVTRNSTPADAEAVQLTLGRDPEWRRHQVKVMKAVSKMIRLMIMADRTSCRFILDFSTMVNLMISCGAFDLVDVLLRIQVPRAVVEADASSGTGEDAWQSVHFHSLELSSNILAGSFMCHAVDEVQPFLDQILANKDFLDVVVQFAMDTTKPIMTCHALHILCQCASQVVTLTKKLSKKKELFVVLVENVSRNNAVKAVQDWFRGGVEQYEFDMMADRVEGILPVVYEQPYAVLPLQEMTRDELRQIAMTYAYGLITLSLRLIGLMCLSDDSIRTLVAKDPSLLKPCVKWLDVPVSNMFASVALRESLLVMIGLCENEALCHRLVSSHNLLELVERGVYNASYDHVSDCLHLAKNIAQHQGLLRSKIGKVEAIARSAAMHMYSISHDVQLSCLAYLTMTIETEGIQYLIKYFGPHHIHYYPTYYFNESDKLRVSVTDLLRGYQHYAASAYADASTQFRQRLSQNKLDEKKAEKLKESGNASFQARKYTEAINRYTHALTICPPLKKEGQLHVWYNLPVTLYSNRAQCHLYLEQYEKAVRDCDKAIARFIGFASPINLHGNATQNALMRKALYRRSKGLFPLGRLYRALCDIMLCVNGAPTEDLFRAHKDKVLIAFRDKHGTEPIPTCDMCSKGVGKKLKRCGNCTGLYCSRDCQLEAWDKFHKANCKEFVRTAPLEEHD